MDTSTEKLQTRLKAQLYWVQITAYLAVLLLFLTGITLVREDFFPAPQDFSISLLIVGLLFIVFVDIFSNPFMSLVLIGGGFSAVILIALPFLLLLKSHKIGIAIANLDTQNLEKICRYQAYFWMLLGAFSVFFVLFWLGTWSI
jgi:hypothetical protein